ncbi:YdeI/OmpD-associated family protein [Chryseolinea soli]|nr:YdeI/OmpD-associated family protein [Chryseolinea soli]
MDKILTGKLKVKTTDEGLVLNAPSGFDQKPYDTTPKAKVSYGFVLLFTKDKAALDKLLPKALKALKEDALFWVAYPKKSSAIKTDITRDNGWDGLQAAGYEAVSLVAIDDTWSALRFRSRAKIPVLNRSSKTSGKRFRATMEKPSDGIDGAFITVPFDVEKEYGTRGQVKVKATFDGHPYRGILAPMGNGGHVIIVRKDIREAIGKKAGDKIDVTLEKDTEERVLEISDDLQALLKKNAAARKFFETLSYTNRKEYAVWITSAKREETRLKRLDDTLTKLLAGKKNPGS